MQERKHLQRLSIVYQSQPRYFVTICTHNRRKLLDQPRVHESLRRHWGKSIALYGWAIGTYVIMPDHVHFFCVDAESKTSLSKMVGSWKQWSAKEICSMIKVNAPLWQREFFDHLIRSGESYSEKWEYVRQNPVRAGLVGCHKDWKYTGHIHYA